MIERRFSRQFDGNVIVSVRVARPRTVPVPVVLLGPTHDAVAACYRFVT